MKKRLFTIILCLLLMVQPATVSFAAEGEFVRFISTESRSNPLYPHAGEVSAPRYRAPMDISPSGYPDSSYISAYPQLVDYVRGCLEKRQESIPILYRSPTQISDFFLDELFYDALEETGAATQGDYLRYVWNSYSAEGSISTKNGYYYNDLNFSVEYYTDARQEAEADAMVAELLDSFSNTGSEDEYFKILEIYNWLCDNVSYDEENLYDKDYLLKYTAYAALANKTAVCQGYATLFYRLALESGLEARIVTGTSFGQNHAWNIVKLYGSWYLLDSTWDAGIGAVEDYQYFLKGTGDFADHDFGEEYLNEPFLSTYPISAENFELDSVPSHVHTLEYLPEKAPGCTEPGQQVGAVCSDCGELIEKPAEIAPPGHSWDEGSVTKEPSRSEEGEILFTCSRCGETKTEKLDKLPGEEPPVNPFTDVDETGYFFLPVMWALNKGVTSGLSANSFGPAEGCTRAQVVTFLWRAAGKPTAGSDVNPFADVTEDAYYYDAVLWAVEQGITTGMSADSFAPKENCSRGQIVTFLWRAMGKPAPAGSENPFADVPDSQYYFDAVLWAVEQDITTGMGEGEFAPNVTCSRGQTVSFLYRAYGV